MASTTLTVQTPLGPCTIDTQEIYDCNQSVKTIGSSIPAQQRCWEDWVRGKASEKRTWYRPRLGLLMISELPRFLRQQRLVVCKTTHFVNCGKRETDPIYCDVKVAVDTKVQVPTGVTMLVEREDSGTRLVVSISIDMDGDIRLHVHYNRKDDEALEMATKFHSDFKRFFIENGPLKGSVFDGKLTFLHRNTGASAKLVLPPHIERSVDRHIKDFIRMRDKLLAKGQETNRGIILSGAPGTGKTLLIRSIIEQTDQTVIVVGPEQAAERGYVAEMFRMARDFAPVLLVMEDIDNGVGIHRKLRDHPILGECLNALDGVSRNDGIFTIASTNYLDRMDPALKDRPGRFSRVIDVPIPNQECRHRLLNNLSSEFGFSLTYQEFTSLAKATDGLTGDWLRETARTADIIAMQDGRDTICYDDLEEALRDVNVNRGVVHRETAELAPPETNFKISDVYI
jgi:hypothetical protein